MKQKLSPAVIVIVVVVVLAVVALIGWKMTGGSGKQKVSDEEAPVLPDDQVSPSTGGPSGGEAPALPADQMSGGG